MKDIFIGKSCLNKSTEFSGARDEVIWNGNINLLEVENKKHIFIRDCVYSFNTDDKIVKYASNVGYNGVPFAIAYGERNIYYLSDIYVF